MANKARLEQEDAVVRWNKLQGGILSDLSSLGFSDAICREALGRIQEVPAEAVQLQF